MNTLKEFIKTIPIDDREAFAERCGASLTHLRFVAWGAKRASCELAINIERETNGIVPVESIRPDADWIVIRGKRRKAA